MRHLEACLPLLPPRLRTVLRLRAGAAGTRPLSAHAVARRLHLRRKRLATLELHALRLLVRAARTRGCAHAAVIAPSFLSVSYLSFSGPTVQGASGGVAGSLYLKSPAEPGAQSVPPAEVVPGSSVLPRRSSNRVVWEAVVTALLGALLVAYVVRDDMGLGPPWRRRRRGSRSGGAHGHDRDAED